MSEVAPWRMMSSSLAPLLEKKGTMLCFWKTVTGVDRDHDLGPDLVQAHDVVDQAHDVVVQAHGVVA